MANNGYYRNGGTCRKGGFVSPSTHTSIYKGERVSKNGNSYSAYETLGSISHTSGSFQSGMNSAIGGICTLIGIFADCCGKEKDAPIDEKIYKKETKFAKIIRGLCVVCCLALFFIYALVILPMFI